MGGNVNAVVTSMHSSRLAVGKSALALLGLSPLAHARLLRAWPLPRTWLLVTGRLALLRLALVQPPGLLVALIPLGLTCRSLLLSFAAARGLVSVLVVLLSFSPALVPVIEVALAALVL